MQMVADRVSVAGGHGPLLPETSLTVASGELAVVHGEPGPGCTAFALVLTGRLRPDTGSVTVGTEPDANPDAKSPRHLAARFLDKDPATTALQARSAIVDVPGINAPDGRLPLAAVVAEELSFADADARKDAVLAWLTRRNCEEHATTPVSQLDAELRTRLLTDLAADRPGVRLLVLDRPDRFTSEVDGWSMLAQEHAERGLAVVVLTATTPVSLLPGPVARIGQLQQPPPRRCTPHGTSPADPPGPAGTLGVLA